MTHQKSIKRKIIILIGIFYEKIQDYFLRMDFFERIPSVRYQSSKIYEVKKVLKKIPTKNRNFLDVGSGKGAVLYLATKFQFLNIFGVEYDKFLCLIAIKNLDKLKDVRVKIINEDIFKCDKKLIDSIDIYYFFNPFGTEFEMRKLIGIIIESFARINRRIDIIYTCCEYDYSFKDFDLIKEVSTYNFYISSSPTKHYLIEC